MKLKLKCTDCGGENFDVCIAWSDCSEIAVEKDAGCTCYASLDCLDCGRVNPIIAMKSPFEVGKESYVFLKR